MRLYGGGPAIYVDGPPVEDLSRYDPYIGLGVDALVPDCIPLPAGVPSRLIKAPGS